MYISIHMYMTLASAYAYAYVTGLKAAGFKTFPPKCAFNV